MTAHRFTIAHQAGRIVIAVTGAFDAETVFDLRGSFPAGAIACGTVVSVNLAATEFLDSSGLGFLVTLSRRSQRENWTLELTGATGQAQRLLQRVGWPTTLAS